MLSKVFPTRQQADSIVVRRYVTQPLRRVYEAADRDQVVVRIKVLNGAFRAETVTVLTQRDRIRRSIRIFRMIWADTAKKWVTSPRS